MFLYFGIILAATAHTQTVELRLNKAAYKPTLWPPQSWRIRRARCLASSGKTGLCMSSGKQQSATTCSRAQEPQRKNKRQEEIRFIF